MLITGIRHTINSEVDTRRSATFMRYLIHYLQMFAFLGAVIPIVIGVDYFCTPQTIDEIVTNKFYVVIDQMNQTEYHVSTRSYHFVSNIIFYENIGIEDHITLQCTPIFKTVTNVIKHADSVDYNCKPSNVYSWPLIVVVITFACSIIFIVKTWGWIRKRKQIKYDAVVNLGIINALLCMFVIFATFFRMLN